MKFFKLFFALQIVLACTSANKENCLQDRGALDIGSGSTKALVAVIDICKNKIVKNLYSEQIPLAFNESLERSKDQKLDSEIIESASHQISQLVQRMKVQNISAVATSAFRKAKNGKAAVDKISAQSQVLIRIISQEQEAQLGVQSALILKGSSSKNQPILVWDIGGGSMQMSLMEDSQKTESFMGDLASVSFKNQVISEVLKKSLKSISSPNPLKNKAFEAVTLAKLHAEAKVPAAIKNKAIKAQWLGIGGVLWHSVRNQVESPDAIVSQSEIEAALKKRALLRDSELGGKYSATDVTNLALVLGYMQALSVESFEPVDASLVQALLFSGPVHEL